MECQKRKNDRVLADMQRQQQEWQQKLDERERNWQRAQEEENQREKRERAAERGDREASFQVALAGVESRIVEVVRREILEVNITSDQVCNKHSQGSNGYE